MTEEKSITPTEVVTMLQRERSDMQAFLARWKNDVERGSTFETRIAWVEAAAVNLIGAHADLLSAVCGILLAYPDEKETKK